MLSLRGGAPKKKGKGDKGKKGDKKGKGDGGKAPLGEGEEMTPEQLKEQVEQLRALPVYLPMHLQALDP